MEIKVTTPKNRHIVRQCRAIARENLAIHGGTLYRDDLPQLAQYLVYAQADNHTLGYATLNENALQAVLPDEPALKDKRELYISQIAVKRDTQLQEVGTALIDYILDHAQGYDVITSNVNPDNTGSVHFHLSLGARQISNCYSHYSFLLPVDPQRAKASLADQLKTNKLRQLWAHFTAPKETATQTDKAQKNR